MVQNVLLQAYCFVTQLFSHHSRVFRNCCPPPSISSVRHCTIHTNSSSKLTMQCIFCPCQLSGLFHFNRCKRFVGCCILPDSCCLGFDLYCRRSIFLQVNISSQIDCKSENVFLVSKR